MHTGSPLTRSRKSRRQAQRTSAMSNVVSMLGNDTSLLPAPKKPALSTYMSLADVDSSRRLDKKPSRFSITISALGAR
ncbi:hypothetical protein TorRG33x02_280160, partial [Trema orientale]